MGHLGNETWRAQRSYVSAALMVVLLATNAQAAVVSDLQGPVWMSRGDGIRPVSIGSVLSPGDRVRTGDGFVVIRYENGCATRLGPRQASAVLLSPPPCHEDGFAEGSLKDGGLNGGAGGAEIVLDEPSLDAVLGGGLVVGVGAGMAVALASGQPRPVSP